MQQPDYFSIGSKDDIVISNSSLGYINPKQGGSPKKFLQFFDNSLERIISVSLEKGTLLHQYHEHEDNFIIADVEKPSKMMADWVERVFEIIKHSGKPILMSEIIEPYAQGAYGNIKDNVKRLTKFVEEGGAYLDFLFKADGKVAMTPDIRDTVVNSMAALKKHKKANFMLFSEVKENMQRIKELEVYWEVDAEGYEKKIKFKAKIDNLVIDFNKKIVYLNDLKSTGKPVSLFKSSFIYYRYYRQLSFYSMAVFQYLIQQGYNPEEWSVIPRIIAVDSTPHYNVHCFVVEEEWMRIGAEESTELVNRIIWHMKNDEWEYTAEEVDNQYNMSLDLTERDKILNEL